MKVLDPSGKTVSAGYFQDLQVHVSISNLTSEKNQKCIDLGSISMSSFWFANFFLL